MHSSSTCLMRIIKRPLIAEYQFGRSRGKGGPWQLAARIVGDGVG